MTSRFVVAGCCRSGTGFVAHTLRAAGVACGHEQVYTLASALHGTPVSWTTYDADSSWLAVPALRSGVGLPVVQVVRHPLDVVRSIIEIGLFASSCRSGYTEVIYRHKPCIALEPTEREQALAMWLHWNTEIMAHAVTRHRVEDFGHQHLRQLLDATGNPEVEVGSVGWAALLADGHARNLKRGEKRASVERPTWDVFRPQLRDWAVELATLFGYEALPERYG